MTIKQAIKFCKAKDWREVAEYLKECVETDKKFMQKTKYHFTQKQLIELNELFDDGANTKLSSQDKILNGILVANLVFNARS